MTAEAITAALARLQARVGLELAPVRFAIDRSDIRRYAVACGEDWPAYLAGDEAPPTFVASLQAEAMAGLFDMDLPLARFLHSDDAVELYAPIRPGDLIIGRSRYLAAQLREGQGGRPLLYQTGETRLTQADGTRVARVVTSVVSL